MELLESVGPRPRQARYQAALRPDSDCFTHSKALSNRAPNLHHRFYGRLCANGLLHRDCSQGHSQQSISVWRGMPVIISPCQGRLQHRGAAISRRRAGKESKTYHKC